MQIVVLTFNFFVLTFLHFTTYILSEPKTIIHCIPASQELLFHMWCFDLYMHVHNAFYDAIGSILPDL